MKTKTAPYQQGNIADEGYQLLENIATGYWYSEALFAALEADLFTCLEKGCGTAMQLAEAACCRVEVLSRLLRLLQKLGLIVHASGFWMNGPAARRYLVRGAPDYMGEFYLYRKYMHRSWSQLSARVCKTPREAGPLDYIERNFRYVRAMDSLARQKAGEITPFFAGGQICGPLLDVGGGAGTLLRAIMEISGKTGDGGHVPQLRGDLFDIPEVIDAAKRLYPDKDDWRNIGVIAGDFRSHQFTGKYGGVLLANFLHAYGPDEAKELLLKAAGLAGENGFLLIHDYFPDRQGVVAEKGALYDVCMMLNTYNGMCHEAAEISSWLRQAGIAEVTVHDLETDSSVILAGGPAWWHQSQDGLFGRALALGFDRAIFLSPDQVMTAPWVQVKCRFGCNEFGVKLQCPPHSIPLSDTRQLLDSYSRCLLVQGQPPADQFHEQLLELEKFAFLSGNHKALVFGAGPCPLCVRCPEDGRCLQPGRARPAMEAAGIDVFATVRQAGWKLSPVRNHDGFVQYFGLLLVG